MAKYPMHSASTVLHPLPKKHWWQETVFWRSVPVQIVVIQHISSGVSIDLIRTYKKLGAKLHAEATPHHFSLTEDAVLEHGTLAKMNPPLRTENDRQQIIAGLADGTY